MITTMKELRKYTSTGAIVYYNSGSPYLTFAGKTIDVSIELYLDFITLMATL